MNDLPFPPFVVLGVEPRALLSSTIELRSGLKMVWGADEVQEEQENDRWPAQCHREYFVPVMALWNRLHDPGFVDEDHESQCG